MKNLSDIDILQLEALWQGVLEPAAQADLEKRLREDPAFYKAAEEWRLIVTEGFRPPVAEQEELAEIRERMKSYAANEAPVSPETGKIEKTRRPLFIRGIYAGLAAAAVILLLLWFGPLQGLLWQKRPSDDFFAHLPRDNANLSEAGDAGRQAYDRKEYQKAYAILLEDVAAGGDSLNLIYAGVAAIGSGQAEQAIPLLRSLLASDNWQFYRAEIRWYLALAYLDQQQPEEASDLLRAIVQANGDYSEQAQALLA